MDPSATLAEVFRAEAEVVLDHVARAVEQLRPGNATDAPAVVDGMLRHLHNLKGAASSVGNRVVEELAHAAEEVLLPSRGRTEGPDASTLDVIEEAVAALGLAAKGQALEAANTLLARIGKPADDQPAEGSNELGPETVDVEEIAEGRDETTLRVPAARLDALVGLTAELTMAEARLQHRGETLGDLLRDVRELSRSRPADPALTRLRKRVDRMVQLERRELLDFHHLTGELRDGVRQLRMIPLASQEPLWRAVARESAATMHRRARLTCRLGTLELDKVVLDALGPAMLHLLRNAVAHGIEPEDERLDAGKPREGSIRAEARARGAFVELTVRDDGRGLDWEAIRQAAIRCGLVEEALERELTRSELAELLFTPGFSTTRGDSDGAQRVRGRGVGLDVVRSQLRTLGGTVRVDLEASAPGTAFVCTMPASVVSTMGLLVEAGGACYALPIEHVRRSLRVRHAELEEHRAGLVPIPDEEPLRIVPLTGLMGWGVRGTAAGRQRSVVVLDVNGARLGVVVDAVRGQTEYVSQPLPYNYEGVPAVRGAVIQSDGSVALALDVPELFDLAHGQRAHASTPTAPQQQRVLVVDDSVSVRTLERDHLQAAGYDVAVAADGQQAWETLQEGSFDLVISDVQMPVLDGLSLTRRIRDDARFADLPVILVSRLGSAADRAASADAGADAYLVKGRFEQQSLVDLVGSYLRSAAAPGPA